MIPLLDILQSIPVLSFLPGVMLAMVALFPTRQIGRRAGRHPADLHRPGVEHGVQLLFVAEEHSARDARGGARSTASTGIQRFMQLELPYAAIGLVWNSMMSVAGGWFFLMACEMFVLGDRDFRLPGLGSYLQTAASAGDTRRDSVGRRDDDPRHRADRSAHLAAGHRVGARSSRSSRSKPPTRRHRGSWTWCSVRACWFAGAECDHVACSRTAECGVSRKRTRPIRKHETALGKCGLVRPIAIIAVVALLYAHRADVRHDRRSPNGRVSRRSSLGQARPFCACELVLLLGCAVDRFRSASPSASARGWRASRSRWRRSRLRFRRPRCSPSCCSF